MQSKIQGIKNANITFNFSNKQQTLSELINS